MKRSLILSIVLFIAVVACSEECITPTNNNQFPEGISGFTSFTYQYLSTSPIHTQTSMLTGYQNKLYRIGSQWSIQVLDLANNSWSEIQLPDSTFWRWDGAAVTITDSIYVVAVSTASNSYDILKLDLSTQRLQHTNSNLPNYFHYPAYCTIGNRIIFFSLKTDSVFEYNSENNQLIKVTENPFLNASDNSLTLSSGLFADYFYVYGGFSELPKNLFYRLNLFSYQWEKLFIPPSLERKQLFGAAFDEQFVLFEDSTSTYKYSFLDNKWYMDTGYVPIYTRDLSGKLTTGEWSFFAADGCLYGTEILSDKVWKISE